MSTYYPCLFLAKTRGLPSASKRAGEPLACQANSRHCAAVLCAVGSAGAALTGTCVHGGRFVG
eukprot:12686563-Prorocentrum_lima.AAC.1